MRSSIILLVLLAFTSCIDKIEMIPIDEPDMLSLNVPDGFNYEINKVYDAQWKIQGINQNQPHKILVYADDQLFMSGLISSTAYNTPLSIPIHTERIEMILITPTGESFGQSFDKESNLIFEVDLTNYNSERSNRSGAMSSNVNDSDGDGIPNSIDLEPTNNDVSQAIYIPAFESYNTIGFEDTWPNNGDYDYNDLVVSFNLNKYMDKSNNLSRVETNFKILAVGAGYDNDFCYTLDIPVDQVMVSLKSDQEVDYEIHGNEDYTEIRFPSIKQAFGTNQFVNTVESETFYEWLEFTVVTNINSEGRVNGTSLPYDFFIRIDGEEGREVHMAGKHPTGKVNRTYFGTGDDNSLPSKGKLYLNDRNLPWAVMIPSLWEYPSEKVEILEAYPDFAEFAQKNGTFPWYSDYHGGKVVRSKVYKRNKK